MIKFNNKSIVVNMSSRDIPDIEMNIKIPCSIIRKHISTNIFLIKTNEVNYITIENPRELVVELNHPLFVEIKEKEEKKQYFNTILSTEIKISW